MAREKAGTSSERVLWGWGKQKDEKYMGKREFSALSRKSAPNISGSTAETGEAAMQQVEGRTHWLNLSLTIRDLSQAQESDTVLKENLLSSQECKTTKFIVCSSLKHRKEDPDPEKGVGKPGLTSDHCWSHGSGPATLSQPQAQIHNLSSKPRLWPVLTLHRLFPFLNAVCTRMCFFDIQI